MMFQKKAEISPSLIGWERVGVRVILDGDMQKFQLLLDAALVTQNAFPSK